MTDHNNHPTDHTERKDITMRGSSEERHPAEGLSGQPAGPAADISAPGAAPNGAGERAGNHDGNGRRPHPQLRAALRREARAACKAGRLTDQEAADLDARRRLPADLPSVYGPKPVRTSWAKAREASDLLDRSGVLGPLERQFRSGPGPISALTIRLMLAAVLLSAQVLGSALITDICRIIAGLDPQAACDLGTCTRRGWLQISYTMVRRLHERVLAGLGAGFVDAETGQFCDLKWLVDNLVAASVPPGAVAETEALAVGRAPFPAWAVVPAACRGGQPGSDGPIPGCSDPDARIGLHPAGRNRTAGLFAGYDAVVAVACARHEWRGDVEGPGPVRAKCPPFIVGVSVEPAGRPPGPAALDAVRRAMLELPRIAEVVADLAIAVPAGGFVRPLHAMGINVVMPAVPAAVRQAKTVTITGRHRKHSLLAISGEYFPMWMPKSLWAPPPGLAAAKRAAWFNQRTRLYAYVPVRKVRGSDGQVKAIRFKCPVCAGRVAVAGQTGRPARAGAPLVPGPPPGQPCCQGTVMVDIGLLDLHQRPPCGTSAHTLSYTARRTQVEYAIWHVTRGTEAFDPSVCRVPGIAAHTMAVVALAVAYNVRLACTRGAAPRGAPPSAPRPAGRRDRGGEDGSR